MIPCIWNSRKENSQSIVSESRSGVNAAGRGVNYLEKGSRKCFGGDANAL